MYMYIMTCVLYIVLTMVISFSDYLFWAVCKRCEETRSVLNSPHYQLCIKQKMHVDKRVGRYTGGQNSIKWVVIRFSGSSNTPTFGGLR